MALLLRMPLTGLKFSALGGFRAFSSCALRHAGHSKWQNIKHRKARQDASRSTQNTKVSNMIYVAAKEGGGADPALNIRLATVIENATKMSIPKKVIEAAIARASKAAGNSAENAQSIAYEGIGPGGVAYIVETLTENKNRTAQQVRAAFLKYNGSLSPTSFLFSRKGWISLAAEITDMDAVFEECLEMGFLEDIVQFDDGSLTLYVDPAELSSSANLIRDKYKIEDMGLAYVADPDQAVSVTEPEVLQKLEKFEVELENLEDVNNVYSNLAK